MGYANPMLRRGPDWFAQACADAGVDGVICVDLPVEEDAELGPALRAANVDFVRLATPRRTPRGCLPCSRVHRASFIMSPSRA